MSRLFLCGLAAKILLLGAGVFTVYPLTAAAQQPQDPHVFGQRMSTRIDVVQMQISKLEKDLAGEAPRDGRPSQYDADSGLLRRLEELDEQCRELERELTRASLGPPNVIYQQQMEINYYVTVLERQVRDIRRSLRNKAAEDAQPGQADPEQEQEQDGMSDEEWAEEWAKGN